MGRKGEGGGGEVRDGRRDRANGRIERNRREVRGWRKQREKGVS